jgi:hypothetical protein
MVCVAPIYRLVLAWMALSLCAAGGVAQTTPAPLVDCFGADPGDETLWTPREELCLSQLRQSASRTGELLTLRLENGQSKTYRDNQKACDEDDSENCIHYSLGGYHPQAHVYSILIRYYEGSTFELVNARTGNTLKFSGLAYSSPDGSNFLVIDDDLAYGGEYDIAVGSTATDPPSLVWQQSTADGPVEWQLKRWIDNDHAALRVLPADGTHTCAHQDCDALLVRSNNNWTIQRQPAKQQ